MSDVSSVGAVIVNWNAGKHLIDCIHSLQSEGISEIVVVDNGSKDNSLDLLSREFPTIPKFDLPNPGFGAAANYGASNLKSDVIFSLNPDTVAHPGSTKALLQVLNDNPDIALVGPGLENSDGSLYPSARRFPAYVDAIGHALFGFIIPKNRWSQRYKAFDLGYEVARDVDWLSGSAMFVRRSAWNQVGGFDEKYFMYMEDVDLCWRLNRAGWKMHYQPQARVTHVGGVSTTKTPYKMIAAHHRSIIRYLLKTTTGKARLLLPLLIGGVAARLFTTWIIYKLTNR